MSRRRRLTNAMRKAILADQSRREANPRPIRLAGVSLSSRPVMTKDKRRHVVNQVLDLMRPWNQTPFEHEGTIRHGIRSGLCLEGYDWLRSDAEAASIVSQALKIIGVPRPTWEQGQRYYADPRENCKWCYGPIAEEDMTGGRTRLFCSDVCARSAYVHWEMKDALKGSAIEREAYRAVNREKVQARECEQCKKSFTPQREKDATRFCSRRCFTASLKLDVAERPCQHCETMFTPPTSNLAAKFCGKACADAAKRVFQPKPCIMCEAVFIPKRADQNCCSQACAHRSKAFRQVEKVCQCCGETFPAKRADARYCSDACVRFAHRVTTGRIKRISPPVLDYLFRQQGLRITGERMAA